MSPDRVPHNQPLAPDEWPTPEKRRYAKLQQELAGHYGVEIESRVVETEDVGRVHYFEAGNSAGRPVVLLHGLSTTGASWLPMVPALTEHRLIVPDRPGRGLSAVLNHHRYEPRSFLSTYLAELLDDLAIEDPDLVGNSLGGLQAFLCVLDHGIGDRLCLVGAPGGVSREFPLPYRLVTIRGLNRLLYWLTVRGDGVENARTQIERVAAEDPSAIQDLYYEMWGASIELPGRVESLRTFAETVGSFGRMHPMYDIRDEITTIERPTCFVWGTEDSFFAPEYGRELAAEMPDSNFHELDGYGHMPWLEPGTKVKRLVSDFLDGPSARRG